MRFTKTIVSLFIISAFINCFSAINAIAHDEDAGMQSGMKCEVCGMNVIKGGKGNFVIEFKDGSTKTTDSPDCGMLLRGNLSDNVKSAKVTDYNTKELADADSAYYVKGADITTKKDKLEKGLMPNSMVAFSTKEKAEAFQKEHGGEVLNYEAAVNSLSGKKMKKHSHDEKKGHGM